MNRNPLIAALAAALLVASSVPASAFQSVEEGEWWSQAGDQAYKLEMCGDGSQLCSKLIWLPADAKPELKKYLNTYTMQNATPTGEGAWAATITIEGYTMSGTVTMLDDDHIKVWGCVYVVICAETILNRVD